MDLHYLREATRSEHHATEGAMHLLGPDLTPDNYIHVLRCLLPILWSWETWADAHAPERLHPLLAPRRRSHFLTADLRTLGATIEAIDGERSPAWSSVLDEPQPVVNERGVREWEAGFLGALYVLEGSTLGGRYLAREVETVLKIEPGQGNTYFQGHGAATGGLWKEVTAEIAMVPEEFSGRLLSTARRTFAAFRQSLEQGGQHELARRPILSPAAIMAGTQSGDQASKLS